MAVVISNRGRLISDLTQATSLNGGDLLIIQSINANTNSTRKTTLTDLSSYVLSSFSTYSSVVNLQNASNKFTGSFFNPNGKSANLDIVTVRSSLTIGSGASSVTISPTNLTFAPANGSSFQTKIVNTSGGITGSASTGLTGSLKGKLTGNVTGNLTGNVTGTLTGNVAGNVIGSLQGNVLGNLTGDILNANSNKILENGSGAATANGGYPNAFFYGTSSYATQALTAAYAASSGTGVTSAQARSYVTTSMNSGGGVANTLPKFSGTSQLGLSSINDNGTSVSISTALTVATKISAGSVTGSFYGNTFKTLNGKSVSFWGTGSHAVSASYAANLTNTFVSSLSSIPAAGSTLTVAHGFAGVPKTLRWVFVNTSGGTLRGIANNGEVDASATWWGIGGSSEEAWGVNTLFWSDSTNCYISSYQTLNGPYMRIASDTNKFDPASALTSPDWKLKCYATY